MPTLRQKKLAKAIIENLEAEETQSAGELLEKVGYSPHLAKQPGRVIEQQGVQEALEEYGFTIENAKMVVSEIMLNPEVEPNARLKATDQVFKVKDGYAAQKTVNLNIDVNTEARIKSKEAISQFLNGEA